METNYCTELVMAEHKKKIKWMERAIKAELELKFERSMKEFYKEERDKLFSELWENRD